MKERCTVEKTIKIHRKQHDIEEVTFIDGFCVYYSGAYEKFFADCDASMVLFRNKLLKRKVLETSLLADRKLFIFLVPEGTGEDPKELYYCNCCGTEFNELEGSVTDGETTWIRCPGCQAERYTEEENYIIEKMT